MSHRWGSELQLYNWLSEVQWDAKSHTATKCLHSLFLCTLKQTFQCPILLLPLSPSPSLPNIHHPFKLSSVHNRPLFKVGRYQILHLKQYLIYSKAWGWIWKFLPPLLSMTPMPFIGWWRWIVVGWGAVRILTTCYKESTRTHLLPPSCHHSKKNSSSA